VAAPPLALAHLGEDLGPDNKGDLLLIEEPKDDAAWERLIAGASLLIPSGETPDLERLARKVGAKIDGGRSLTATR
jgi:hypothetical protein